MVLKTKHHKIIEFMKAGYIKQGFFMFLFLFLILTLGANEMGQKQEIVKLTKTDKKVMKLINNMFPIDTSTFRNTTPDENDPYWISSLRRYQAMDKNWIISDPPGPPRTFIVNPSKKVFLNMAEALTSIKYIPKDASDAMRIAIIIASISSPDGSMVIINNKTELKGCPKNIIDSYTITPSIKKNNEIYETTIFSYISTENKNRFVHGYHALWKHIITFSDYTYKEKITILWEKRD